MPLWFVYVEFPRLAGVVTFGNPRHGPQFVSAYDLCLRWHVYIEIRHTGKGAEVKYGLAAEGKLS